MDIFATFELGNGRLMDNIEVKIVKKWDSPQIVALYKAGNWWKEYYSPDGLPSLISNSFAFAVAIDTTNNTAIGMGRVISDGVSDAYIQDVVVIKEYRRHDIGKAIIDLLINQCQNHGIEWIGLIAEPGSIEFYTSLHFEPMKDHVPMLLKTKGES